MKNYNLRDILEGKAQKNPTWSSDFLGGTPEQEMPGHSSRPSQLHGKISGSMRGRKKIRGNKTPSMGTQVKQRLLKKRLKGKRGLTEAYILANIDLGDIIAEAFGLYEAKSAFQHRDAVEKTARRKQATNDDDSGMTVMGQGANARSLRQRRRNKAASYKKEIRSRKKVGGLAYTKRPKSIKRDRD